LPVTADNFPVCSESLQTYSANLPSAAEN
jgi:hypothetical protein